ncbi:MAG: HlyD family secretion protein [Marinoscillum sp.]
MLKNKRNLAVGGVIILLLIVFLVMSGSSSSDASDIMIKVTKGEFIVDVTTTGELEAKNSTEIMGPGGLRNYRIWQVNLQDIIDEGTYVQKGQYVARLDPSELKNKIGDTQLEVEEKQSQFVQTQLDTTLQMRQSRDEIINLTYAVEERELILEQSQFEPPATIKQAEIDLAKAKRDLEQKKQNYLIEKEQNVAKMQEVSAKLRKSKGELQGMLDLEKEFIILAPQDGMLIYQKGWDGKPIKAGSQIHGFNPVVATLPDLSSMNSVTYVNEVDIRKISIGQKVDIGLDAFPEKKLTGVVTKVANVGEQRPNADAKVFQVTIELDKVDGDLRPAMTTSNTIFTKVLTDAVHIPLECLHNYNDTVTYVFKKSGLNYEKQEVKVGATNTNEAQIEIGLEDGEAVYLSIPSATAKSEGDITLLKELNGKRGKNTKQEPEEPKSQTPDLKRKRPNS